MSQSIQTVSELTNANWLQVFLFGVFPYIAAATCIIGTWARFDLSQYSWKTGSSQMLRTKGMRVASNLFHIGILGILGGHFVGLLTPHDIYAHVITSEQKQLLAMVAGGIAGVFCWIGLAMLMWRRFMDPRISHTSSFSDKMILVVLFIQLNLGMLSIFYSASHSDPHTMLALSSWAQNIVTLRPIHAVSHVPGTDWVFQVHISLGLMIIFLFPFTRLVHFISAPIWYLGRRYQIVRQKKQGV